MGLNLILFSLLKKRKKQSFVNEPMLIQIAVLAWIFLGEGITQQEITDGEIEDHLSSINEVEAAGVHKAKYAIPYENNHTIFIGRGLKRSLREIREINKIFI